MRPRNDAESTATHKPLFLRPRRLAVAVLASCVLILVGGVSVAGASQTQTFAYTGGEQTFTVPAGVTSLEAVAVGGNGGSTGGSGGAGARVAGELTVTPGETLYIEVGGNGEDGGFNGGGSGGGGGGGASDMRTSPLAAGLFPDDRVIVAGGGGGAGENGEEGGAAGGAAGEAGQNSNTGNYGGQPGTQTEGGAGGRGIGGYGSPGGLGFGGEGGRGVQGGGGGSGYYGGGGGGGASFQRSAGGGGGSSLIPAGGSEASSGTEPQVQITYASSPAVTGVSPSAGGERGGTSVTITGENLTGATAVKFGSTDAYSFKVNSATSIAAIAPPGTSAVDVTVTTPSGTSATSSADQYTYLPATLLTQQGSKLTGSGEVGTSHFGRSVAVSGDGNTALVGTGVDNSNVGAVWVFTRSGSTWTQQTELKGAGEVGAALFGENVALSSDGNTALISGEADNSSLGAVWIFTRSGSTWTQQGEKLTGSGETGKAKFGSGVSLSSDGNNALVGGSVDNTNIGAAWVFTRSGTTWSQQGSKLTASEETGKGKVGTAAALSGDGNTALVGGPSNSTNAGAAWVFTRSGSTWTQQTKLTGEGEIGNGSFGSSGALSSDGNTALVGGPNDNGIGAAWVFTRSGASWSQQGSKLTGSGESGSVIHFAASVALASNGGNTALVGGYGDNTNVGAAWVFLRSGSTWSQQGSKLTASDENGAGLFGISVAISADSKTAVLGGSNDAAGVGAAWVFATPAPSVTGVSPNVGSTGGGTSVTITGSNLSGATGVNFGSSPAASFTVSSATSITAVSPGGIGTVDVTVATPEGISSAGSSDQFSYASPPTVSGVSPNSGSATGGTSVGISGTNFTGATAVKFGSTNATSYTVNSPTSITAVSPPGTGTVDVTVTNPGGTSPTSSADEYTYIPVPTVTGVSPGSGPAGGGTAVTITGTNFTGATAVDFGSTSAASYTVNSSTSISATSPSGTGTVDVTVATGGGTTATSSADHFEYVPAPTITGVSPNAGPEAGGTSVTVTGTNLSGASAVKFNSTNAASYTVNSATSITAVSPAGAGTVDVTVTTTGGTSATGSADQFTYAAPPTVTGVNPNQGPTAGGTSVTVTGTNLSGASAVKFGSTNAASYTVNSATAITAVSPTGAGTVDVTVTTPGGTTPASSADHFTYVPAPTVASISPVAGPAGGGTKVAITGTNFTAATAVKFGSTNATSYTINSATSISAVSPAGTGTVDVTVTTAGGTSATSAADQFSYAERPTVSGLAPNTGPGGGGTSVTVSGANLSGATAVKFGSHAALTFTVNSSTSLSATSPAGTGAVDVTVTTPGGTSATSSADQFTYLGEAPEFGRCIKVTAGAGGYGNAGCTAAGGTKGYEWYPAFGGASPLGKTHFTVAIKPTTTATLETLNKTKVTCTGQTGAGEYTANKAVGGVTYAFTGCESASQKCTSPASASGEIVTKTLEGSLGIILTNKEGPTKNTIGLDLKPVGGGAVAEFTCGTTSRLLRGSVIVQLAINAMKPTQTLKYTATKAAQKPSHFEGEGNDIVETSVNGGAFELTGLILTTIQTNAEKVEVNSVV